MAAAHSNADTKKYRPELAGENDLQTALSSKDINYGDVNKHLDIFRYACLAPILKNLEVSDNTHQIEGRLWDTHVKVNGRFRKALSRIRDIQARKRTPVEKRKLEGHYLNFIKASQRFYRGYISRIRARFNDISELELVTDSHQFRNEGHSPRSKIDATADIRRRVLLSCHSTLIRLGDLSRYREMELVPPTKMRKWDRAIGYYALATIINPNSGTSHNQLAIISLADGNHLMATYHLYRALCSKDPYPTAGENLKIEFRKILGAWSKGEPLSSPNSVKSSIISPFIYLHAQCDKGIDFAKYNDIESGFLSSMRVDIKEQTLETALLQKFCLINIAAENHARSVALEKQESGDDPIHIALSSFTRLNIKTFSVLIQLLLSELESPTGDRSQHHHPEKLTGVVQCILPVLRNYSSWLLTNYRFLSYEKEDFQIQNLWKIYANTLTFLASTFKIPHIDTIAYLLQEDEDILGFAPLINDSTSRRYKIDSAKLKPRVDEVKDKRNTSSEMLFRIRDFVIDALDLIHHQKIPLHIIHEHTRTIFVYKEDLPDLLTLQKQPDLASISAGHEYIQNINQHTFEDGSSQAASITASAAMHRMVDNLVGSEPASSLSTQDPLSTPIHYSSSSYNSTQESSFPYNQAIPLMPAMNREPSYSPRLPSIYNSPFAPQPDESINRSPAVRREASYSIGGPNVAFPASAASLLSTGQQFPSMANNGMLNSQSPISSLPPRYQREFGLTIPANWSYGWAEPVGIHQTAWSSSDVFDHTSLSSSDRLGPISQSSSFWRPPNGQCG